MPTVRLVLGPGWVGRWRCWLPFSGAHRLFFGEGGGGGTLWPSMLDPLAGFLVAFFFELGFLAAGFLAFAIMVSPG